MPGICSNTKEKIRIKGAASFSSSSQAGTRIRTLLGTRLEAGATKDRRARINDRLRESFEVGQDDRITISSLTIIQYIARNLS